ncbi:MAG TPA: hypothetical protein VK255_02895 [Patescibacteria group bacterium]|nr:hypothetical protein [Patescibacteria group bacterium]
MKKYAFLLIFPTLFILAGCGAGVAYPKLYIDENLPQYADAALVQIIQDGPTLKDGVILRLESSKDVKTIAAYYDGEMKKLGWVPPTENVPTNTSYATQWDKGDKYLHFTASNITGKSQTITISLMQK